jgi:5'-phosphate synthase pdxT subunit
MTVGILALQGDFEAHARVLERLGTDWAYVKRPEELAAIDALIIPGGESSTFLKFLEQENFLVTLRRLPEEGKPLFGTCAGAILLAKEVLSPAQASLGLVDITIERNAYGRQLASAVRRGRTPLKSDPMEMVFIRAPIIRRVGQGVQVLGTCDDLPVCVEQDRCLLSTFHPELTDDITLHRYFLQMAAKPVTSRRVAAG